ncbi:MAG: 3-hydroxybutyryl-CoA dehydrogenase [Peptococcaceae bacterium]
MKNILVIGAGTMGSGIAQVAAQAGYHVFLNDVNDAYVQKGIAKIEKNLSKLVSKGRLEEAGKNAVLSKITPLTEIAEARNVELVIEAVIENMELKKELLKKIAGILSPETIFASNTSALSITELAAEWPNPERFIGMHFFNPVPVMKLVEIIKGAQTSDETFGKAREFVEKIGKTGVAATEAPGFIVNRMLVPLINEGVFILAEGTASPEDIDTAMKLGANHPIGPLALADMIGLDVCLAVMETLYEEFADSKYRPCPLLRKMVKAGYLGCKTGRGFFSY